MAQVDAGLEWPWVRRELIAYLEELSVPDPRPLWRAEAQQGLVAGIDQVIHFFLDDHEFDAAAIGFVLLNQQEVESMKQVTTSLERILNALPHGRDDDYVEHPFWPEVARVANEAHATLAPR